MKTIIRSIIAIGFASLGWVMTGSSANAQVTAPIQISYFDSSQVGVNYLCAQPWIYYGYVNVAGLSGGTPVDSVAFNIDYGDGTITNTYAVDVINQGNTYWAYEQLAHTYSTAGTYSLTIAAYAYKNGVLYAADTIYLPTQIVINNCDQFYGRIFLDVNNDCVDNSGDVGAPYAPIHITDASSNPVGYIHSNAGGYYSIALPTGGTYTATVATPFSSSTYNCSSGAAHTFTLSGTHTHDYALQHSVTGFDLAVMNANTVVSINGGRYINFHIGELLSSNPTAATVSLTLPNGLTPSYSSYPYTIAGNTMTFNPVAVAFGGSWYNNYFYTNFNIDTAQVHMGDTVCFTINVAPTAGDVNTVNNTYQICAVVLNSYDPNNKLVSPQGLGTSGAIPPGQTTLKYTVNFQNTGNSVAYDIDIVDTLDTDLDLNSFVMESTSHPCQVIFNGNVVTFRFNSINLPDSNSNEPESHGFVRYNINVPASASLGTEFTNTAYIYFDVNPPIITNTTINTIAQVSVEGHDGEVYNISFFPNPTHDIVNIRLDKQIDGTVSLMDMSGKVLTTQVMNTQLTQINVAGMSSGVYILEVRNGQFTERHKLIIE